MRSESIQIIEEDMIEELPPELNPFGGLPPDTWFTDAGIAADGRCWVAPSEAFYAQWLSDDTLKARIDELGFDWGFDGASVGAWCEFIFYCPPNMGLGSP
jgi:hypothetical protein